ncbi:MAG: hypothetical protein ACLFRG_22615, partial [Desulfococcaceae bacterium]
MEFPRFVVSPLEIVRRFDLQMRFAGFQRVQHRIPDDALAAKFAESAASGIIYRIQAAQGLAAAQTEHLFRISAGKLRRESIDLLDAPFGIHDHDYQGRVAIDG